MLAKMGQNRRRRGPLSVWGVVVLPVDLSSTWIPLSLLGVLCLYMVFLFMQERRESRALLAAEAAAAAMAPAEPSFAAAPSAPAALVAPVMAVKESPARRKPRLVWRTAWIWLPFMAGFAGQAYLDIIKPLVEKAGV